MNLLILGGLAKNTALKKIQSSNVSWIVYQHDCLLSEEESNLKNIKELLFYNIVLPPKKTNELSLSLNSIFESILPPCLKLRASFPLGKINNLMSSLLQTYEIATQLLNYNSYSNIFISPGSGLHIGLLKSLAHQNKINLHVLPKDPLQIKIAPSPSSKAPHPKSFEHDLNLLLSQPPQQGGIATGSERLIQSFLNEIKKLKNTSRIPFSLYKKKDLTLSLSDSLKIFKCYFESFSKNQELKNRLNSSEIPRVLHPFILHFLTPYILKRYPISLLKSHKAKKLFTKYKHKLLLVASETGKDLPWTLAAIDLNIPIIGYIYDNIPPQALSKHFTHIAARSHSAKSRLIHSGHTTESIHLVSSHLKNALDKYDQKKSKKTIILALGTWFSAGSNNNNLANFELIQSVKAAATTNPKEQFIIKLHPLRMGKSRIQNNCFLGFDNNSIQSIFDYAQYLNLPNNVRFAPSNSTFYDYTDKIKLLLNIDSIAAIESMSLEIPTLHLNNKLALEYIYPNITNFVLNSYEKTPHNFANLITNHLNSEKKLRDLAKKGKNYVDSLYWTEQISIIEFTSKIYASV